MTGTRFERFRGLLVKILRNPHFWVVVAVSAVLLLIYQAWPWRDWQFTQGVWRYFSWLSVLDTVVVNVSLKYHVIGVLFFVPIIYGSLTLSWQGGVFAWLLALIWVLPTLLRWSSGTLLINLALLLLPALLVAVVTLERRRRERERRFFLERENEHQVYTAKLVEVQEGERQRIAQEIHDETLQTLMVIANKADVLTSTSKDEEQKRSTQWIKEEVLQTMDDLRRLSLNLRPSILDNFGSVSALRWLVNNNNLQGGVQIDISIEGDERKISHSTEVAVFRVAQEAIHNIQRHAQAERAGVLVEFGEDRLRLTVRDDGVGFQPPERLVSYAGYNKLGIIGMEQRVLAAEGTMTIKPTPGGGTTLQVSVPYGPTAPRGILAGEAPNTGGLSAEIVEG